MGRVWETARLMVEAALRLHQKDGATGDHPDSSGSAENRTPIGRHLVSKNPRGSLNQSIMELGRRLCGPRTPDCPRCPLKRSCYARRADRIADLPRLPERPITLHRRVVAMVVSHRNRYLARQRVEGGINAGLWEFPNAPLQPDESPEAVIERCWPELVWPLAPAGRQRQLLRQDPGESPSQW